jgi:hypothetical protein
MTPDVVINLAEGWVWGWSAIEAIATLILVAGIGIAVWQIFQTKRSTNAQIAVDLFNKLRSDETKRTLRYIYSLNRENLPIIYKTDIYNIENLIDQYGLLGALVDKGIIDESLAIDTYAGPPALRCWYQLAQFLKNMENDRGSYYTIHFEDFVYRTIKLFRKEEIDVKLSNDYEKDISLMDKLQKWIKDKDPLRPRKLKEIRKERKSNRT